MAFCVWLLSLSVSFSRLFVWYCVSGLCYFLWLSNIPLDGWATFYSSVHWLMDICVFVILAVANNAPVDT